MVAQRGASLLSRSGVEPELREIDTVVNGLNEFVSMRTEEIPKVKFSITRFHKRRFAPINQVAQRTTERLPCVSIDRDRRR